MKRTVSLFQFMPYGAPELLAAARPNLGRALVVASLLPIAAFLVAWSLMPLFRATPVPVIDIPPIERIIDPDDPQILRTREFPEVPPVIPVQPDRGEIVPVDKVIDETPPVVTARDFPDVPPGNGNTGVVEPHPGPGTTGAPEAEPIRGVWIYTDVLPQTVFEFKPEYPDLAREAGVEGLVVVHALIGKDGSVMRVELDPKKNVPMLNATALEAAMKWKFTPALANEHPVVVWFAIPFKFVLH